MAGVEGRAEWQTPCVRRRCTTARLRYSVILCTQKDAAVARWGAGGLATNPPLAAALIFETLPDTPYLDLLLLHSQLSLVASSSLSGHSRLAVTRPRAPSAIAAAGTIVTG